jgi:RNA polymerase sigma-70 factor (ECF subfamily)
LLPEQNEEIRELIETARTGSREALGTLLDCFRAYLCHVANEELDAELKVKESPSDLVQQTCLEAMRAFGSFRGDTSEVVRDWLRQILLNNVRDLRERYQTKKRQIGCEAGGLAGVLGSVLPDDITPPSQVAERNEEATMLEHALARLDPEARRVIEMRHRENRSFAEIAIELGISNEAARKRWARAIIELRRVAQ